ncbi:MAG: hypothetical protein LCH67_00815 [Bacteroidetes bacterium]|jgi:hypothetical protein|nr:hypothetical protein [Bacteroidota bacterium]
MSTIEFNSKIVDGYLGLFDNLSTGNKLDLIARLSASVKSDLKPRKSFQKKAFGAFDSSKSGEEIIKEIRESRELNRQIESF